MGKKYIYISLIIILIICFLFNAILIGCTSRDSIVGKWSDNSGSTIDFYKDGTVVFAGTLFGDVSAEYSFPDENHIKFSIKGILGIFGDQVFEIKINGNKMSLNSSNTSILLERVKPNND
jgi:hypothetical protein